MNFVDSVGVPGEGDVAQVIVRDADGEGEPELEPEGMPPEVDVEGVSDEPDPPWDETVLPDGVGIEEIESVPMVCQVPNVRGSMAGGV